MKIPASGFASVYTDCKMLDCIEQDLLTAHSHRYDSLDTNCRTSEKRFKEINPFSPFLSLTPPTRLRKEPANRPNETRCPNIRVSVSFNGRYRRGSRERALISNMLARAYDRKGSHCRRISWLVVHGGTINSRIVKQEGEYTGL